MTITIDARRAALAGLATAAVVAAYLLGTGHGDGGIARAATSGSAGSAGSAQASMPSGVTVSGTGMVAGTPDRLLLAMGVEVTRGSVDAALDAANVDLGRVMASLKKSGVAGADLQTSGLTIDPEYDYGAGGATLKGYQVSESLNAKLRDLDTAGRAISAAANAGGNDVRINGISLDLESDSLLVKAARDEAFADAKAKAEQYAKAAGRSLGAVQSISEQTSQSPPLPYPLKEGLASAGSPPAPVPVQPGSAQVSVSVTVVWALAAA